MEAEAAVADQSDAAVETFEPSVVEAEADRVEDPVAVAADCAGELNERLQARARCPGQPGVEVGRREGGVVEVVEQPEFLFEQERAVERLVGLLDFVELGELVDRLLLGTLQQRPAGAFDPFPRRGVGAPSLSTSGETLTIEESMNLEGENGATPGCWRRARMEPGLRMMLPPAAKTSLA
jgi:hypothetical protein